jgi:hypothetical protein
MVTKRNNKNQKNKTRKHKLSSNILKPSLKILKPGYPLYASKKSYGDKILEHTQEEEKKYKDSCLFGNMSWFGDLEQAKSYKTKEQNIYKWKIKNPTKLLIMNKENEKFFHHYFTNSKLKLSTLINLNDKEIVKAKKMIEKSNIKCAYFDLTQNERAFFEFKFAYGYISVEEQYQFLKIVKLLINNKFIDIKMREGTSIIKKLNEKIDYYYFFNKTNKKEMYNRLSIYLFDKYALNNLCKIIPSHFKISGVLQKNTKSFWFPDLVIYKMNIKEYVLFNPHHNLIYNKIVE